MQSREGQQKHNELPGIFILRSQVCNPDNADFKAQLILATQLQKSTFCNIVAPGI